MGLLEANESSEIVATKRGCLPISGFGLVQTYYYAPLGLWVRRNRMKPIAAAAIGGHGERVVSDPSAIR